MHVFMGSSRIIVPNLGWNLSGNFIMAADLRGSISNDHFQSWEIFSALETPSFIPFPGKLTLKSMFALLQRAVVKLFSCSTLINIANWEAMTLQNAALQIYFALPVSSFHRESTYVREFDIAYAMELINWNKKQSWSMWLPKGSTWLTVDPRRLFSLFLFSISNHELTLPLLTTV